MMKPEINRDIISDRKILCEHYESGNLALMQAAIIGSHWIDRASEAESKLKVANHLIARLTDEKTDAIIRAEKMVEALDDVWAAWAHSNCAVDPEADGYETLQKVRAALLAAGVEL